MKRRAKSFPQPMILFLWFMAAFFVFAFLTPQDSTLGILQSMIFISMIFISPIFFIPLYLGQTYVNIRTMNNASISVIIGVTGLILTEIAYHLYSKRKQAEKLRRESARWKKESEARKRENEQRQKEREELISTLPSKIKLMVDDKKIVDISEIPHGTSRYSSLLSDSEIINLIKKMKNEEFGCELEDKLIVESDYLENKLIYFSGIYPEKDISFSFLAEGSRANNKLVSNKLILRTLEKLKHQRKILGEINPTNQSIKFGESNKRSERASKVIDTIDKCNVLWRNITKSKNQLFNISSFKVISYLYEGCVEESDLVTKVGGLYNLLDKIDKEPLIPKGKRENNLKPVTLLDDWLKGQGIPLQRHSEITQPWRKIIKLRTKMGTFHETAKEVIDVYRDYGETFPDISYSRLWDKILEEFLESLEKLQKILTEISQKNV